MLKTLGSIPDAATPLMPLTIGYTADRHLQFRSNQTDTI